MIKIFFCAVIITGSAFIGFSLSKNEKKRLKALYSLLSFARYAKEEIKFKRASFDEIISSYENKEKEADRFFDILSDKKSDKTLSERISDASLDLDTGDRVKRTLTEFAGSIGKYDAEAQELILTRLTEDLTSEYENQTAEMISKGRLYRSVSALIGIAAVIILY